MAFRPQIDPGEKIEADIALVISEKPSLRLVLTNRAAYWPGKKAFAVSDAVTTERLVFAEILSVATGKRSSLGSLAIGLVMVVGGIIWTLCGYAGAPQALVVGGVIVAIVGGRRRTLLIRAERQKFMWTEPITFGGGIKTEVTRALESVRTWAQSNGLRLEA